MPPSTPKTSVRISTATEKSTLSKAQKQFNTLIKKINTQKTILQAWHEVIPRYHQRLNSEYRPLWDSYNAYRVELVYLLDTAHGDKFFKKNDKAKLADIICDLCFDLIQSHGKEDLKELYNRHNAVDFDTEDQETDIAIGDMMKAMAAEMFDVEFDDEADVSSPEKFQAALDEKLHEREEQQRLHQEKRKKRKSVKQLEKEAQQKQTEQEVSKSIQTVFRQLVAVLHPDREPDETERERKTKLMQRVNTAYGKKDLLALLALQLEIEQIDQSQLANIAEDRLKHFNKVLKNQLDELEQEIEQQALPFKMQLNVPPFFPLSAREVLNRLDDSIQGMQLEIKQIESQLKTFEDFSALKMMLKSYRL